MSKILGIKQDIIVALSLFLGLVMATALPVNVLSSVPILQDFTDLFASIIPSIDHVTTMSNFPEVTRLFFSVMWLFVPLQIAALLYVGRFIDVEVILRKFRGNKTASSNFMSHVALLFLVSMGIFSPMFLIGGDIHNTQGHMPHEVANRLISSSRFWLGLLGSGLLLAVAFCTALLISWFAYIFGINSNHYLRERG